MNTPGVFEPFSIQSNPIATIPYSTGHKKTVNIQLDGFVRFEVPSGPAYATLRQTGLAYAYAPAGRFEPL